MLRSVILDARELKERDSAHAYLKEMLELPEYYGRNLDALYDCLTEMSEREILFVHTSEAGNYFPRIRRVFEDARLENPGLCVKYGSGFELGNRRDG